MKSIYSILLLCLLLPSVALSQGNTFGGGGTGSGGSVNSVSGTGSEVTSSGTTNVTLGLADITPAVAGVCTNCDLVVDTKGRITSKSNGTAGSGSGATTETSGVVHPTPVVAGVYTEDFAVGGTDATAKFFFDATTGSMTLNQPGAGINVAPHATLGAQMTLSSSTNGGGLPFTLKVLDAGLTSAVTCTIQEDGSLDLQCPWFGPPSLPWYPWSGWFGTVVDFHSAALASTTTTSYIAAQTVQLDPSGEIVKQTTRVTDDCTGAPTWTCSDEWAINNVACTALSPCDILVSAWLQQPDLGSSSAWCQLEFYRNNSAPMEAISLNNHVSSAPNPENTSSITTFVMPGWVHNDSVGLYRGGDLTGAGCSWTDTTDGTLFISMELL